MLLRCLLLRRLVDLVLFSHYRLLLLLLLLPFRLVRKGHSWGDTADLLEATIGLWFLLNEAAIGHWLFLDWLLGNEWGWLDHFPQLRRLLSVLRLFLHHRHLNFLIRCHGRGGAIW